MMKLVKSVFFSILNSKRKFFENECFIAIIS